MSAQCAAHPAAPTSSTARRRACSQGPVRTASRTLTAPAARSCNAASAAANGEPNQRTAVGSGSPAAR